MLKRTSARPLTFAAAVLVLIGGVGQSWALLPDGYPTPLPPPFLPPVNQPPPPVITPPPIHNPPPVAKAPEPGTLVLGLIAAGVGSVMARRRKHAE